METRQVIEKQIENLEVDIRNLQAIIGNLDFEIEQIENDVNHFLSKYFKEMNVLFNEEKTDQSTEALKFISKDPILSKFLNNSNQPIIKNNISLEINKKFRKLASLCHPDKYVEPDKKRKMAEIFNQLRKAKDEQNFTQIIHVEQMLKSLNKKIVISETLEDKLLRLAKEFDALSEKKDNLRYHKNQILRSSSYKLKNQAMLYKIRGINIIDVIKKELNFSEKS